MTEREMNMGLEYSIVANKPVEASLSWVKAGEEVSVVIEGDSTEIIAALRGLFDEVMEMPNGEKIIKEALLQIRELIKNREQKDRDEE